MIGEIGLLTREGLDVFYPVFKDMENWMNDEYDDPFPSLPFSEKPKGPGAAHEYKARLERVSLYVPYLKRTLCKKGLCRESCSWALLE